MSSEDRVRIRCPQCEKSLTGPAALQGKIISCPNPECKKAFAVRAPAAGGPPPLPDHARRPGSRKEAVPPPPAKAARRRWLVFSGIGVGACLLLAVVAIGAATFGGFGGAKPVPKAATLPAGGGAVSGADTGTPPGGGEGSANDMADSVPTGEREGLDFPPVGPTPAVAGDRVALDFKTARVAYHDARKKARAGIRAQFTAKNKELFESKTDPKVLREFNDQAGAFAYGPGKNQDGGPLPTHPAMQAAVADYWQAMNDAVRKFGEVAEAGLAAYEKAGTADPNKLRPLLAARLASQHPEFLGIWASGAGQGSYDVWVVDVDEATGTWRLDGSMNYKKGATGHLYHAANVEFAGKTLSFQAFPVDTKARKVRGASIPVSLELKDDTLYFKGRDRRNQPFLKRMRRTNQEAARASIEYWGVPKVTPVDSGSPAERPDAADPNYVWRRIAVLSSFPAFWDKHGPAGGEKLFIPYRSSRPSIPRGTYGGLADMLRGRAPGAGQSQEYAEVLFKEFDHLAESPFPYLRRAAGDFQALLRARIQLAEADELFGNTPNSSIREFQQKVFLPAGKYVFQREVDRLELQDSLQRQHPDKKVIVHDAPLSAASRKSLSELIDGTTGIGGDVKKRAVVSGLLAYADMAQVDRASHLWRTWLLPLAKRCGGPASEAPLVAVEGEWKLQPSKEASFARLKEFRLRNVSGQDLTHAVVEMLVTNEWGDEAAHYYCFHQLNVAEVVRLMPHPRWNKRLLPFTNTISARWSVWADQAREVDRGVKLTNPSPNPDPAGWRRDYEKYDKTEQAKGEALGSIVRNFRLLPLNPDRQRRRLLQVAAPGTSYLVRVEGEKPSVVRFLRLNAEKGTVEAEVLDLATRKPIRSATPVWKGSLTPDKEAGHAIRMDSGWRFFVAEDDQPTLALPHAGGSSSRLLPMARVKLP